MGGGKETTPEKLKTLVIDVTLRGREKAGSQRVDLSQRTKERRPGKHPRDLHLPRRTKRAETEGGEIFRHEGHRSKSHQRVLEGREGEADLGGKKEINRGN